MTRTYPHNKNKHYFEVARETAALSFDDFLNNYYLSETPVIVENIGKQWPALNNWNEAYIRKKLSQDSTAKAASLWYWMEQGALDDEYKTPEIITKLLTSDDVFPRTELMRIWAHPQGNVSSWHYDANMVNVFNAQIKGSKEWFLVSPETPLKCYPFTSFAIMENNDEKIFKHKSYTHLVLKAGDMLYIPPLWFHKVVSLEAENLNLNWIFTNKRTTVSSPTLRRELNRYALQRYLSQHRFKWVQKGFATINQNIPGYLRWKWRYPNMIKTPLKPKPFALLSLSIKEFMALGSVLLHAKKIKPYIQSIRSVKKLD